MSCDHQNFTAQISVGRVTDGELGSVVRHTVEVMVQCVECGVPLQFVGLPVGIDTHSPTMGPDGLEARLVAVVQGQELSLIDRITATFADPTRKTN